MSLLVVVIDNTILNTALPKLARVLPAGTRSPRWITDAPGSGLLILARVVMGLGAAFAMPATPSIFNAVFPPVERPQAIAAWSAVLTV